MVAGGGETYHKALDAAKAKISWIDQEWNRQAHLLRRKVLKEQGELEIEQEQFGTVMAALWALLDTTNAGQLELLAAQASAAISEVIIHMETEYLEESSERRGWTEVHLGLKQAMHDLSIFLNDLPDTRKETHGLDNDPRDRVTVRLRNIDDHFKPTIAAAS
ncbi:hypothetical protein HII36_35515 [Nonomuraea sp. NN258]|uniref:hypothetical protein n=1 Tax=Nonomuraea antri TaxID=2730852 RepID=UPI001569AE47|nr:hypothetical protein [Nonomuraea antri]NRQ37107.1 hypothetical protein [Nonomuraea antri]